MTFFAFLYWQVKILMLILNISNLMVKENPSYGYPESSIKQDIVKDILLCKIVPFLK